MNLTVNEILVIIEKCKGFVKTVSINKTSIHVEFLEPQQPISATTSTQNQGSIVENEIPIPEEENLVKDLHEGKTKEQVEEERLLDELPISDPSKFEDLIVMNEVVDAEETND